MAAAEGSLSSEGGSTSSTIAMKSSPPSMPRPSEEACA
eukprot:CAMPEP_0182875796 /NCGR_PEP_ID=MMETSP0034_2-20130328/13758_1 /TAXON_ID=156128 /ORGANISM="Nephroselmis pyriformis, Strain CCMP717" /LENGTH=37 /DNA_ID= /DNA_START= /DNA_END= /DNA_ORIENTATION=